MPRESAISEGQVGAEMRI